MFLNKGIPILRLLFVIFPELGLCLNPGLKEISHYYRFSYFTTGNRLNSKGPFSGETCSHHSISPDGKWVLFNSGMLTNSDIMLVPLHPQN